MRLLLIRHGQTDSNVNHLLDTLHPGAPLNTTGLAQAQALVEALRDEPIEAIYASALPRAQQTAAPLATARGLELQVLEGAQEISAGEDDMSPDWSRYVEVLQTWSPTNLDVGLPGGETARQFLARYSAAMRTIEEAGHAVAALVSHGAAMRVWGLTASPTLAPAIAAPLDNTEWIVLEGSCDEGWRVLEWAGVAVTDDPA